MSRLNVVMILLIFIIGAVVGGAVGVAGLLYATGGNAEPSRDVAAVVPTLSLNDPTPTPSDLVRINQNLEALSTQVADLATLSAAQSLQLQVLAESGVVVAQPTIAAPTAEPTVAPPAESIPLERALFRMVSEESEARFKINETLAGNPTEVIGTTSDVAGDIIVNYQNPSLSTIGQIAISARTLRTDNNFRNQSIRGQILESSKDEFEFIYFSPTQILNLVTAPLEVGSTVNFQVVGDLTIKNVTRSVTFDLTLTAVSMDRIEGLATTTVLYSNFGLTVNPPPTVSDVSETVILELTFIATQVVE